MPGARSPSIFLSRCGRAPFLKAQQITVEHLVGKVPRASVDIPHGRVQEGAKFVDLHCVALQAYCCEAGLPDSGMIAI